MQPELSVVVPAMNEEANIPLLVEKVARGCALAEVSWELVLIDDGSTDGTLTAMTAAARAEPRVNVLRHRRRQGLTRVMCTGFAAARGAAILWIPADLESDPEEDIPKLYHGLREHPEWDVVCGWRQGRGDGKVLTSRVYNALGRWLFGVDLHDMNWIKMFRRACLRELPLRSDWHRFLVMVWAAQGFRCGEVPTNWHPRHSGRSKFGKLGWARVWAMVFDIVGIKLYFATRDKPLRFFGGWALVCLLLAAGLAGYAGAAAWKGWSGAFAAALGAHGAGLVGALLVGLGVVGELLVSLRHQLRGGPAPEVLELAEDAAASAEAPSPGPADPRPAAPTDPA